MGVAVSIFDDGLRCVQGFRKTDPERWEFTNESFQKGRRDLLASIARRKPAGSSKLEHHDGDDDLLADDRSERASLPGMSPRQPVGHFTMPSPRDQFPPGMLPPLEHFQQAGLPRRGSFTGPAADVFQSPREAFGTSSLGAGMSPREPHQSGGLPAHQAGLASPRGFSSFQRQPLDGGQLGADGARVGSGDVDMLSGSKAMGGGSGGVSSAFAAPAGQGMAPSGSSLRPPQQAGLGIQMSQQHAAGSGGLEGMHRFTRLVDNVMGGSGGVGGSGSSNQTNECGVSNNRSPGVSAPAAHELSNGVGGGGAFSNGDGGPPPPPPLSQHSDSHSRQTHSAEQPTGSGGQPTSTSSPVDGDYGQADMEDATVKKRKYRRSTERRQMQPSGAPCVRLAETRPMRQPLASSWRGPGLGKEWVAACCGACFLL